MNEYFREIAHTMKYGNAVKAAEILEELKKPVPSCPERNAVLNQAVSEHWSAVRTDQVLKANDLDLLDPEQKEEALLRTALEEGWSRDQLESWKQKLSATSDLLLKTSSVLAIPAEGAMLNFLYKAEAEVETEGKTWFLKEMVIPNTVPVFSASSVYEGQEPGRKPEGCWHSLMETLDSPFAEVFLLMDQRMDEKASGALNAVYDTRGFGTRYGFRSQKDGSVLGYAEQYRIEGENRLYLQVIMDHGSMRYELSHATRFLGFELGDSYRLYCNEDVPEAEQSEASPEAYDDMRCFAFRKLAHELFLEAGRNQIELPIPDDTVSPIEVTHVRIGVLRNDEGVRHVAEAEFTEDGMTLYAAVEDLKDGSTIWTVQGDSAYDEVFHDAPEEAYDRILEWNQSHQESRMSRYGDLFALLENTARKVFRNQQDFLDWKPGEEDLYGIMGEEKKTDPSLHA